MAEEASRSGDLFEDLLSLEDQYFKEGYDLGVADGSRAGRIEGRVFGLQKGFEKFVEIGKLHGKAAVWKARLPATQGECKGEYAGAKMPTLSSSDRLEKHVHRFQALTDPASLSMENNEDAVSEFDDRLKDAKAKATLIARITQEDEDLNAAKGAGGSQAARAPKKALRVIKDGEATKTGEMEDFQGLPGAKKG